MAAIGNVCAIPFTMIVGSGAGGAVPQYLYYDDGGAVTWRKGVRNGNFVLDKTLDATGFAGVEDVNWENVKEVIP